MTKYTIFKENYKAAENYLLSYAPEGFMKYPSQGSVKDAVEELLESFDRHPDTSYVACGGLMVMCDEENFITIYVDPKYRYKAIQPYYGTAEPKATFELV